MKKVVESKVEEQVEEQAQPTEVVIAVGVANALLQYLNSKPYGEVSELIKEIKDSKLQ